jgi:hypothetical protein
MTENNEEFFQRTTGIYQLQLVCDKPAYFQTKPELSWSPVLPGIHSTFPWEVIKARIQFDTGESGDVIFKIFIRSDFRRIKDSLPVFIAPS